MIQSGINSQGELVEIIEVPDHPWFLGVQFHPEYKSTVANPHPVFVSFVNAAKKFSESKSKNKPTGKLTEKTEQAD
jgi:CTP synthase